MPYRLLIKKQAKKMLQTLSKPEQSRASEKIILLKANPDNHHLDIKKLEAQPYFRLRVGQWRVIFDRKEAIKIISIEKIKSRGDAYK